MTPALWRAIADADPFRPDDPRVMSLCWCLFLMLTTHAYDREHTNAWSRTVWFEAVVLRRKVRIKAMAHLANGCERVMTLMTPEEGCAFVR